MALPNTTGFVRGNVYVVIEGSYGDKTLSTATSGTTTITIEYLTSDHSAVAGYSSTLHDGQAVFDTIVPATQYWIVDGKVRTESNAWTEPTGYGFRVTEEISASTLDGQDCSNSQFRYIDIGGTYAVNPSAGTIDAYSPNVIRLIYAQQNVTFTRCAIHNGKTALVQGAGADGLVFEYCHFGPGWGKEAIRGGNQNLSTGWTIRYCRFWNSANKDPNDPTGGITAEIGIWASDSGSFDDFSVYGNWFYNEHDVDGRNAVIVIGGNGSSWVGVGGTNNVVYNNTFAGIADGASFAEVLLNGTGNTARNNLFYDCTSTTVNASTTSDNDVVVSDPFANYATFDLRLSGATNAGFSLSSPHNTDPLGNTRGSDGTFDVGAYEFTSGGGGSSTINATTTNATNLIITP